MQYSHIHTQKLNTLYEQENCIRGIGPYAVYRYC
jgi:hypothetical protein